MIMQTVFFKLSRCLKLGCLDANPMLRKNMQTRQGAVMPYEEAVEMLKKSIKKMYGKKAR